MKQLRLRVRLFFLVFMPALWEALPARWRGTIRIFVDSGMVAAWVFFGTAITVMPAPVRVLCGVVAGLLLFRFIVFIGAARTLVQRNKAGITAPPVPQLDDRTLLAAAGLIDEGQFQVAVMAGSALDRSQRQAALRAIHAAVGAEQRKLSDPSMN